jgi:hypothetical protein
VTHYERERPRDSRDSDQGFGKGLAIGALIAGLTAFLAALFRFRKKTLAGFDDSPIIIKSGSFRVALRDGITPTVRGSGNNVTMQDSIFTRVKWNVAVAALEAGFPVSAPVTFANVTKVVLHLLKDNDDTLDVITITRDRPTGLLTLAARDSNDFANFKRRKVEKSPNHKERVFHKKCNGDEEFEIGTIEMVTTSSSETLQPGPEYALAFDFEN